MVPEGDSCRAGLLFSDSRVQPGIGSSMSGEVCNMQAIVYWYQ